MEDVQERGKRIACHITNLSLVHESLIEEIGRVLFLDFFLFLSFLVFALALILHLFFLFLIFAVCLLGALVLLHCHSRDVKPHLDKLVRARTGLPATVLCATRLVAGSICLTIKGKLHGNFILSGKIGIQNLGVRKLEGRSVLDVEGQLGLGEIRLSPVPSPESMFAGLHVDTVPDLERLAQSLEVLRRKKKSSQGSYFLYGESRSKKKKKTYLLVETIQLDDTGGARKYPQFKPLGRATPLG